MKNLVFILIAVIIYNAESFTQEYYCKCTATNDFKKYFEEKLSGRLFYYPFHSDPVQFFNEWTVGDVFLTNGNLVKNENLRYHGYLDQLLWARHSGFQTVIVDKETVAAFVLYNKNHEPLATFKKIQFKNWYSGDSLNTYMQVLAEGYVSLYAHRRIKMIGTTDEMYPDYIYYVYINGYFKNIQLGRLSLVKLLADDKSKIRSILRKNHLKVKKEPDLIKAIELYNEQVILNN